MASGIEVSNLPDRVVSGLALAQLDFQLIEYHKLMAQLNIQSGNTNGANENLEAMRNLIYMQNDTAPKRDRTKELLADMDKWVLLIDKQSIPVNQRKLILRPEFRDKNRRGR